MNYFVKNYRGIGEVRGTFKEAGENSKISPVYLWGKKSPMLLHILIKFDIGGRYKAPIVNYNIESIILVVLELYLKRFKRYVAMRVK